MPTDYQIVAVMLKQLTDDELQRLASRIRDELRLRRTNTTQGEERGSANQNDD